MNASNNAGESTIFVQFMLELIRDILRELAEGRAFNSEKSTEDKVIALIKGDGGLSAAKIAEKLGLSARQIQRVLKQLKDDGMIEHHGANGNGHYEVK